MEILNTYSTYNEFIGILGVLTILIAFVFMLITVGNLFSKQWKNTIIYFIIMCLFLLMTHGLIQWWRSTEVKNYEVLISDYNQVDFNKYSIVERKGKITVLKEIK